VAHVEVSRPLTEVERELRTPRAAGVAGLVFSALFVLSMLLLYRHPPAGATAQQVAIWYGQKAARNYAIVGLYLVPFSGIAFLWFIAAIRSRIGDYEDRFFATVFLGSGILFVAMLFGAAAVAGASLAAVKFQQAPPPGPDIVVFSRGLAYTLLFVYAIRAAAVFMVVVSTIGYRTRTLHRGLALAGYVIALLLLFSVSYFRGIVFIFPLWVASVSVVILHAARGRSAAAAG
jgi:hypothetical protein